VDAILTRLIEHEEAKIAAAAAKDGMPTDHIAAVKRRLLAEKDAILTEFDSAPPLAIRKKSSAVKIWGSLSVAAVLVMGLGLTWLLRRGSAIDARLVVAQGDVKTNGAVVQAGVVLAKENSLTTGNKSLAVLRFGEPVMALVGQNTQTTVRTLGRREGKPDIELQNSRGVLFAHIEKGQAHFNIQTPTAVLGVRGTSFSVRTNADGSDVVSVLEGSVETRLNEKFLAAVSDAALRQKLGQVVSLAADQKIVISPSRHDAVISPLNEAERGLLLKMQKLVALTREKMASADANRKAAIDAEIAILTAAVYAAESESTASAAPKMTLADIRKKYGKVSRVNLKTGKSYTGFFILKGAQMEIITTSGTVRVPAAQLSGVQDIQ
jgi:hypothetical protein